MHEKALTKKKLAMASALDDLHTVKGLINNLLANDCIKQSFIFRGVLQ
jgi:hypothetical protein